MSEQLTIKTQYRPGAQQTLFASPDQPRTSKYNPGTTVWGRISSSTDLKHEQAYVRESSMPRPTTPKKPDVTVAKDPQFNTTITGRELTLPACSKCGEVAPSTVQKTWTDRRWAALPMFLNPMECLQLESLRGNLQDGVVGHGDGQNMQNLRRSQIAWIERNEQSEWIYSRLWSAIESANERFFGYDIQFIEPLQYSVYHYENSGFYTGHYDWGANEIGLRKLSFSVQLSNPQEYAGGELVLYTGENEPVIAPKEQGTITVFPSWMYHEVRPVTQGVRRALVGWFEGPVYF